MSFSFSVLASEFEFAIALGEDLEVAAGQSIGRGNIADGRVQPHRVVVVNGGPIRTYIAACDFWGIKSKPKTMSASIAARVGLDRAEKFSVLFSQFS